MMPTASDVTGRLEGRPARTALACAVTLGGLAVLFGPFSVPFAGPAVDGVDKAAHVLLFGVMAFFWRRATGERAGARWAVGAALAALALAVEFLQPLTGRTREMMDWVAGSLGVLLAVALPLGGGARLAAMGVSMAICGAAFVVPSAWALWGESRAWPCLLDGGASWSAHRWLANGLDVARSAGGLRLRANDEAVAWRGVFRRPARQDWDGMGDLELNWTWEGEKDGVVAVRIDPRLHEDREPSYGERFQLETVSRRGENRLVIPAEAWRRAGDGGPLDPSSIAQWGFFLVEADGMEYVSLHDVRFSK